MYWLDFSKLAVLTIRYYVQDHKADWSKEDSNEVQHVKNNNVTGDQWTTDLKPLQTDWVKEYLTDAPYLILVFKQLYSFKEDGTKRMHYYSEMSVSLASGILLAAIHVRYSPT